MKLRTLLLAALLLAVCAQAALADITFPGMITPAATQAPQMSDDALIRAAVSTLRSGWQKEYLSGHYCSGEHIVDIRGTRLIRIKGELGEKEAEYFGDIACVIDFLFYDDYYGVTAAGFGAGYYEYSGTKNCVVVHRNGLLELAPRSPFILYRSRTYNMDFSPIIEEVVDYRDQYNQVMSFTVP